MILAFQENNVTLQIEIFFADFKALLEVSIFNFILWKLMITRLLALMRILEDCEFLAQCSKQVCPDDQPFGKNTFIVTNVLVSSESETECVEQTQKINQI